MDKPLFYILFSILMLIYLIMAFSAFKKTKLFLSRVNKIDSHDDLQLLRNFVTDQMRRTLIALPFGGGAVLLYFVYLFTDQFSSVEVLIISLAFVFLMVCSFYGKRFEKNVFEIPSSSEEIENQKNIIIKRWHENAFSKFDK